MLGRLLLELDPPTVVTVAERSRVTLVRRGLPQGIDVVVRATPEVEAVRNDMRVRARTGLPPTQLVEALPVDVADAYAAASALWHAKPWERVHDDTALDVEHLGVRAACIVVEDQPLPRITIAPTDADGARWFGEDPRDWQDLPMIEVGYVDGGMYGPAALRDVTQHGWSVPSAHAVPVFMRAHGSEIRPPSYEELELFFYACHGLASFVRNFPDAFDRRSNTMGREVRVPFESRSAVLYHPFRARSFDREESAPELEDVGRTLIDKLLGFPCACGSRRPAASCCAATGPRALELAMAKDAFAARPDDMLAAINVLGGNFATLGPLAVALVLHIEVEGQRSLAERHAGRTTVPSEVRRVLEAERVAWVSLWEVVTASPDDALVVDLLTGTRRTVRFPGGAAARNAGQVLLGRVLTHDDESYLWAHALVAPFPIALPVVEAIRSHLRASGLVPSAKLRGFPTTQLLIDAWTSATQRASTGSPSDHPTRCHFAYEPRAHDWVLQRLAAATLPIERSSATRALVQADDTTEMVLDQGAITMTSSSDDRLRHHRAKLLAACGDIVFVRSAPTRDTPDGRG